MTVRRTERERTRLDTRTVIVAALASAAFCLPYLLHGQDTPIRAHDNLDANWVWYQLSAESGAMTRWGGRIPGLFGGLPTASLGNDLYVPRILVWMVGVFPAYVVNQFVIRFIGFLGVVRLLKMRIHGMNPSVQMCWLVALLWAWQPLWPPGGLSIAGLPLLASAYLGMRRQQALRSDYVVMALTPLYSTFLVSTMWATPFVILDMTRDAVRGRPIKRRVFGVGIYLAVTIVVEVEAALTFNGPSHRTEWPQTASPLSDVFDLGNYSVLGNETALNAHVTFVSLPVLALIAPLGWLLTRSPQKRPGGVAGITWTLAGLSLIVMAKTSETATFMEARALLGPELRTAQWRFDWLAPLAIFIGLSIGLVQLRTHRVGRLITGGLVIVLAAGCLRVAEWNRTEFQAFSDFYAIGAIEPIAKYVERCSSPGRGAVGVVGFHPAVAQYHGLDTVGGYFARYPLEDKKKVRQIIASELARDDQLASYFDDWGSRAYLFTAELGRPPPRTFTSTTPVDVDLDLAGVKQRGGGWILSTSPLRFSPDITPGISLVTRSQGLHLYSLGGECPGQNA